MKAKENNKKVSILMLTHNAPKYVLTSIVSVRRNTKYKNYELIVLDNKSNQTTRLLLKILKTFNYIDTLSVLSYNSLFAKGNNIAAAMASNDTDLYLLLNSDVRINDDNWLNNMIDVHKNGVTSYGIVEDPRRADGYCYLIDADVYKKYPLDESYEWWWAITKQQALILNNGYLVAGFRNHEKYLHHYGGKSGSDFKRAKGMSVSKKEVGQWFNGKSIVIR